MAMFGDIEQLVLSGKLFNGDGDGSRSPPRSPSPDQVAQWPPDHPDTDEELFGGSDNNSELGDEPKVPPEAQPQQESIGMGPGRTGVKGVIRDRDEHEARARAKRMGEIQERNARMEKSALTARTFFEDEAAEGRNGNGEKQAPGRTTERFGRFGHLREVGSKGFVQAVEGEDRAIWVVVHIYDESLDRCARLDAALVDLARRHPQTKFLRARAAALGFASKAASKPVRPTTRSRIGAYESDDEEDEKDSDDDVDGDDDDEVDLDMLPTMLVYRDGELVHNWVRVDWEVKIDDVEELLSKCVACPLFRHAVELTVSTRRHHIVATVQRPLVSDDDD
ncbi:thioredoxin-like protein [Exidia glandulosa HHB12029]|uniref:Thioredoxin-like protein n=1 Tax=Exidia glandulosa HHB12029 TaxID=1314781 RepID=A0A165HYW6_EXIGL|nr:thioredoxin-like protein [Exidia glandulosa HHB12029]